MNIRTIHLVTLLSILAGTALVACSSSGGGSAADENDIKSGCAPILTLTCQAGFKSTTDGCSLGPAGGSEPLGRCVKADTATSNECIGPITTLTCLPGFKSTTEGCAQTPGTIPVGRCVKADESHPALHSWDGTGPKTEVKLGADCSSDTVGHTGCSSSKTVTFQAAAVEGALTDALKTQLQNVTAGAATYTQVPSDFLGDLSAAGQTNAAFQLMFRTDGKDFDDAHGFTPSLRSFETLKCREITGAKVAGAVAKFHAVQAILSDDQDDGAKQAATKFKAAIGDAVNALINADAGAKLFNCDWDNHDDSDAGAIISVDATTRTARVLFAFNGG